MHVDLCIIGSGSGNSVADERFADLSVALVDDGIFGGTCLNVGCIPTKMFVHPADLAVVPQESDRLGVRLALEEVRWAEIRDRVFGRIDPISAGGLRWRSGLPNTTVLQRPAHFTGPHTLDVGGETLRADQFVLAAGSRATLPPVPGLESVTVHTSDTVMRLERLPRTMLVLGGGYVAAEFAHVFAAYGVAVTLLCRGPRMLSREDTEIADRFTRQLGRRVDLRTGAQATRLRPRDGGGVLATVQDAAGESEVSADVLLVATGRRPNGDRLNLDAAGVALDPDGYVVVDAHQRTTAPHIWALGDVSSHHQLKHVANHEARVVQHNLLHPDDLREADHRFVPHAVFSHPQVAAVGLTEQEARRGGHDYVTAVQPYGSTAFGWAMEDEDHVLKLVADRVTGRLLGAHVVGPEASVLIQPLIQAMSFGQLPHDVARGQYWIHPSLSEVVENALLALPAPTGRS